MYSHRVLGNAQRCVYLSQVRRDIQRVKARKAAKHPQYAGKLSHPNVNTAEVGNPDLVQSQ